MLKLILNYMIKITIYWNLNTSHVKVNRDNFILSSLSVSDLNTSHVKVNLENLEVINTLITKFKYNFC